jgi:hypothetical protein
MFSMILQFRALFKLPANNQTHSLFMSLVSSPLDSAPDEASIVVEDSELWRDYAAVGFDTYGNLQCLTANACWE